MSSLVQVQNQDLDSKKDLLKKTVCKGSTDDQFQLFLHACKRTGLDPFMRQIYAVIRKGKDGPQMAIQTGIDGYRLIADRTGKYSPGREPEWKYDDKGRLVSSTSFVRKMTEDGTWHEVAATAFFSEYSQKDSQGRITTFWERMGHTMIAKCAEALALRKAFPAELSGIYTAEEMSQADVETTTNVEVVEEKPDYTKTIEECTLIAKELWDLMFDGKPAHEFSKEMPYYLEWWQKTRTSKDIRDSFDSVLSNRNRFVEAMAKWYRENQHDVDEKLWAAANKRVSSQSVA